MMKPEYVENPSLVVVVWFNIVCGLTKMVAWAIPNNMRVRIVEKLEQELERVRHQV